MERWCIQGQGRTQEFVLEGARSEAPRSKRRRRRGRGEWGEGVPLPSRLGGLGERRELPQRGPKTVLVHFGLEKTHLVATNLAMFIFFCDWLLFHSWQT